MALRYLVRNAAVALGLCLAGLSPVALPCAPADINHDHHVDVRDVQNVSVALLASQAPSELADVNHDGRVDILDLQCVVNQATGAARRAPAPVVPIRSPQQIPSNSSANELLALKGASSARIVPPEPAVPAVSTLVAVCCLVPGDELYRVGLSAHGPPNA